MRVRHAVAALVGGLVAGLVLGGCAEAEPEPKFEAAPSQETTVADEPEPERETVREFAQRWADLERDMQNTGDTGPYLEAFPECAYCARFAETVETYYGDGGFIETDGQQIRKVRRKGGKGSVSYLVTATSEPTRYRTSSDTDEQYLEGGDSLNEMLIKRHQGAWQLLDIYAVAQ